MQLHIEKNATGVTITTPNGAEFGFRKDGKGGVECSSKPRDAAFSWSELATIEAAAKDALYEPEEA